VQVARRRVPEQPLQVDLPRGGIEQVGAAHHVGHALRGVADHDGELVGKLSVGPKQHEVADLALDHLPLSALGAILEADRFTGGSNAQGTGQLARGQAVAAAAGIDLRAVGAKPQRRIGDLAAGAAAPVGLSGKAVERGLVVRRAAALVLDRAIPGEAEPVQRAQDCVGSPRLHARRVQVLDAHQPAAARRARVEPARERRHQRAEMQRTGGRGREPADVHGA